MTSPGMVGPRLEPLHDDLNGHSSGGGCELVRVAGRK
jgi:hypothetical protein